MKMKKKKAGIKGWRLVMEVALVVGIIGFLVSGRRWQPIDDVPLSPPPRPQTFTIQFKVGDEVYTNYNVRSGATCPCPDPNPSSPEGKGDFLQWVNADDETVFNSEDPVHAEQTWVAQFEGDETAEPKPDSELTDAPSEEKPIPSDGEGEGEAAKDDPGEKDVGTAENSGASDTSSSEPEAQSPVASEPESEKIQLVFTGRDGWKTNINVQVGAKLGPDVIPAAPDLSDKGWVFSRWSATTNRPKKYEFGQATTNMPQEFVAVYTNLPIRIEYVVDGETRTLLWNDWRSGGSAPSPSKMDGFEFKRWLDDHGQPLNPENYKTNYVPVIQLTAKFEQVVIEDKSWPTLTVIVKSKGTGLVNSATVCFTSPQTGQKYEQEVECVGGQDALVVIKPDADRKFAPKAANLMVTVTDARGERVGNVFLMKENGEDREVTVPVSWTENELKKAKGLCNSLKRLYDVSLVLGAQRKEEESRLPKLIRDELKDAGFEGMGYDTFKDELYPKIDNPGLSPNELDAFKPYWP